MNIFLIFILLRSLFSGNISRLVYPITNIKIIDYFQALLKKARFLKPISKLCDESLFDCDEQAFRLLNERLHNASYIYSITF